MREKIVVFADAHRKAAPHASDEWAASDRGWLRAKIVPAPMAISVTGTTHVCLGHWLDYERKEGEEHHGASVHAVSTVTRESQWFATPAEALAWLLAQAAGRVAEHFASAHNGYEHRKAEIRRMAVDADSVRAASHDALRALKLQVAS